jgi:acetyl esterase/lipase
VTEELPAGLAPDVAALLPRVRDLLEPPAREVGLDEARRRFTELLARGLAGGPDVAWTAAAVDTPAGELPARVYRPEQGADGATVVLLHGGGWTVGDVAAYDGLARRVAARAGAVVVSVEFRRAPEHPFPAAVDDAVAATRWAVAHAAELGGDPRRVAVAGDSGGGNLAAVVCQQLRRDPARPAAALLLYPNTSRGGDAPSVREFGGLPFLPLADMAWYTRQYVPRGTDLGDPRISPREGDLTELPPTLLVTAELDALRDSGREYAEALRTAGGVVEHLEAAGQPHGFAHLAALAPSADAALGEALDRFRALLHAVP